MRDKIILLLFVVSSLLGAFSYVLWRRVRSVASERDDYAMVAKAYASACEDSEGESRVFRLRIGELTASSDSLMRRMDSLRREIGVRDKRLRAIHYRETVVERRDTIVLRLPAVAADIDTVVDDGWVRTAVSLRRPDSLSVSARVRNETTIVVKTRRETVEPPKRFFLLRWFQRRHTVVTVVAKEGNPWCETREFRSVEIVE